jgi:hypothetical protein
MSSATDLLTALDVAQTITHAAREAAAPIASITISDKYGPADLADLVDARVEPMFRPSKALLPSVVAIQLARTHDTSLDEGAATAASVAAARAFLAAIALDATEPVITGEYVWTVHDGVPVFLF